MPRWICVLGLALAATLARAEAFGPDSLGVVFAKNDPGSARIAEYYATQRHVPRENLVGLAIPDRDVLTRAELAALRSRMLDALPTTVQSLLLIWARPFAVECMSVTTAFAVGYQAGFCEPGCGATTVNPLYDSSDWLPADTVGWLPAMLLPTQDEALARRVIDRGVQADGSRPPGTVFFVRTADATRNVRAAGYADAEELLGPRIAIREVTTPIDRELTGVMAYFTGAIQVKELPLLEFRPGAVADHLTSTGGVLEGGGQMPATAWLAQGATGSYGTVSEPCNVTAKFPNPGVLLSHYLRGDTLLEAYWKSVAMPGQGLFIGEPLARPFPRRPGD
jgi:uncharacterized protein (TIGR03790 family)